MGPVSTVELGYLIRITAKFYVPHSKVRQIVGVYGGKVDHAPRTSHLYRVIAARMMEREACKESIVQRSPRT